MKRDVKVPGNCALTALTASAAAFTMLLPSLGRADEPASTQASTTHTTAAASLDDPRDTREPSTQPSMSVTSAGATAGEKPDATVPKTENDDVVRAYVDAALGFGKTDVLNQRVVGPLLTQEQRELTSSRFSTQSIILGFDVAVVKSVKVGAFFPLTTGNVFPDAFDKRGTTALGNFSMYGSYERAIRKDVTLTGSLTLAVPTAQGEDLPTASEVRGLGHIKQGDYDRSAVQQATIASRGREDIATFTPKHFGFVPKVGATWRGLGTKLEVEPYVKYQSLHATGTHAEYIGSFVAAVRGTYRFHENVDGTLRVWTDVPVTAGEVAGAAFEPQVRGHFGSVMPIAGVIVPVAGRAADPQAVGVRLALAAAF